MKFATLVVLAAVVCLASARRPMLLKLKVLEKVDECLDRPEPTGEPANIDGKARLLGCLAGKIPDELKAKVGECLENLPKPTGLPEERGIREKGRIIKIMLIKCLKGGDGAQEPQEPEAMDTPAKRGEGEGPGPLARLMKLKKLVARVRDCLDRPEPTGEPANNDGKARLLRCLAGSIPDELKERVRGCLENLPKPTGEPEDSTDERGIMEKGRKIKMMVLKCLKGDDDAQDPQEPEAMDTPAKRGGGEGPGPLVRLMKLKKLVAKVRDCLDRPEPTGEPANNDGKARLLRCLAGSIPDELKERVRGCLENLPRPTGEPEDGTDKRGIREKGRKIKMMVLKCLKGDDDAQEPQEPEAMDTPAKRGEGEGPGPLARLMKLKKLVAKVRECFDGPEPTGEPANNDGKARLLRCLVAKIPDELKERVRGCLENLPKPTGVPEDGIDGRSIMGKVKKLKMLALKCLKGDDEAQDPQA
ncbi:uncharacterized protein LOC106181260 [Lingula anatina]|uniref:Uncharacterized protein LOC106181260 n=1 Tax=Lingula anatina TaxID=7574 RepID=A0A1S3KEW6_LINAN|nr:uncharacterized protein LOC106181260 [Lingula anatina]|eukprot:XP_013421042.1 uncharacterized protein LOC106181260 [Lingula anatina]